MTAIRTNWVSDAARWASIEKRLQAVWPAAAGTRPLLGYRDHSPRRLWSRLNDQLAVIAADKGLPFARLRFIYVSDVQRWAALSAVVEAVEATTANAETGARLPTVGGEAFAYSPYRVVPGYTGPVAIACATNAPYPPTVTVPVTTTSDGQPDTAAAVAAFGPVFHVSEVVDQRQLCPNAVAKSVGARARWDTSKPNSKHSWMTSNGCRYEVATGAFERQSVSLFEVVGGTMQGSNANSTFMFGDGFANGLSTLSESSGRGVLGSTFARSSLYHGYRPTVTGFTSSTTACKVRTGDQRQDVGGQSAKPMTGFTLGGGYYPGDSKFHHGWIGYNVALSDANELAVKNALDSIFNIVPWTIGIFAKGDSIEYGQGPAFPLIENRFFYLQDLLPANVFMVNTGVPGASSSEFTLAQFASRRIAGTTQIYMENYGSNDFAANKTALAIYGVNDVTANTFRNRVANAKANTFKVVGQTTIRRTPYTAAQETERASYRMMQVNGAAALGIQIADYGDTIYPTADGIHPSSYSAFAAIDAAAINAALAA